MHLLDRIDHWGKTSPEKIAHVSGERTLTYGELITRSDALAAWLAAEVPHDRSPIAVLGHREPEMLIAFLGVVKSGRPYVPLDVALPANRIEKIIAASGTVVTLTPELVAEITSRENAAALPRRVGWDDPYYVLFTSGSTG